MNAANQIGGDGRARGEGGPAERQRGGKTCERLHPGILMGGVREEIPRWRGEGQGSEVEGFVEDIAHTRRLRASSPNTGPGTSIRKTYCGPTVSMRIDSSAMDTIV